MSNDFAAPPRAWEPLTPRGVAAFARAPFWRLLLAQVVVALLAAAAIVWFLKEDWFPVARAAIQHLPAQGEIRGGRLDWPEEAPVKLAGNQFLELTVDPAHLGRLVREAQLRLEFGRAGLRLQTLLGEAEIPYPGGWRFAFNQTEVQPWWGAWEPALLAGAAVATFVGLLVSWTLLATLYCALVKFITLFENRDLTWGQSWRLAGAALIPAALFLIFGILFYGLVAIPLIQLAVIWCLHVVIGWIYLFLSPLFLPRTAAVVVAKGNPFLTRDEKKP
jgi:hypothetical protein